MTKITDVPYVDIKELYYKMEGFEKDLSGKKVDCEVMKHQITYLSNLCGKMDTVIEKLMDAQNRNTSEIYNDMEKKRLEVQTDIKDIHARISNIDRNLTDKLDLSERRIMDEIKALRKELIEHNDKEDSDLKKLLEWKWMIVGAVVVMTWIMSNISLETLVGLMK